MFCKVLFDSAIFYVSFESLSGMDSLSFIFLFSIIQYHIRKLILSIYLYSKFSSILNQFIVDL